ncbi:hypothetical protein [Desertihabitans brevis]|nr:hypothetical protein [Desertihabitans brevis]
MTAALPDSSCLAAAVATALVVLLVGSTTRRSRALTVTHGVSR